MAHSDLNFYQTVLRDVGIRYLLSGSKPDSHVPLSPNPSRTVRIPSAPANVMLSRGHKPITNSSPELDTCREIPPMLLKYRRPAYCVWTYFKLPRDIKKGFTKPRCELVNKIIQNLQWSRNTYTFWPLSTLEENGLRADADLFLEGITIINPVYIFIFGSNAYKALLEDREYTYGLHTYNNYQVIALPDLDSLLPDNRLLKNLVWNILKKYTPTGC